jgi:hypothetical protein
MGPDLSRVEGKLIEKDSASYLIAVSNVKLRSGGDQVWSGEQVRIRPEHFYQLREKKFSTGRTIAMGALLAGGFTAAILSVSLLVSGTGSGNNGGTCPPDCGPDTRIGRP